MQIKLTVATTTLLIVNVLAGCASAKLGDKAAEADLKRFQPKPDKVSVYVCREDAFAGGGVGTEAFVNGRSIGAIKPNTFAYTEIAPGDISVFLRRNGIGMSSGDSGSYKTEGKAGSVVIVWAGVPGGFIGPLTVDKFANESDGKACVAKASYAIP